MLFLFFQERNKVACICFAHACLRISICVFVLVLVFINSVCVSVKILCDLIGEGRSRGQRRLCVFHFVSRTAKKLPPELQKSCLQNGKKVVSRAVEKDVSRTPMWKRETVVGLLKTSRIKRLLNNLVWSKWLEVSGSSHLCKD